MRNWLIALGVVSGCIMSYAVEKPDILENGIDMKNTHVYHYGFIDLSSTTNDFRDAEVAHVAISVGQLVGVNPETGQMITNAVNLLPIMVRSAYVAGEVNAGHFSGDGSGLTGILSSQLSEQIPLSLMPTSGVWNVEGLTLQNANLAGLVAVDGSASISGDLSVGNLSFSDGRSFGNSGWYIPERGDLSMGNYTQGGGLSAASGEYIPDASDLSMGDYTQK